MQFFYSSCCVFQEQGSGRKIGLAKEKDELYYLETVRSGEKMDTLPLILYYQRYPSLRTKDGYFRFGHPSFLLVTKEVPIHLN